MNNHSDDPLFDRYQNLDFEKAKPVEQISALAKLQAVQGKVSKITLQVDNDTLAIFKAQADVAGTHYQTLMNEALRQFSHGLTLSDLIKETTRD